ncbi:DUF1385 domain-containing protein [bacterium]|nr:DUF1385 domain-containing protein [bacterium]
MILADDNKKQDQKLTVGGQAVIEGVMMRSPWRIATAVRHPDGSILVKSAPFISLSRRNKLVGLPIVRGAVGLFEAMKIGVGSLNWSAEIAGEEEEAKPATLWDKILQTLLMIVSFAAGLGLFMAVPYFVAGLVPNTENQIYFHLIAGGLRIFLLIGYMAAISFIPDITEVFRYHGAEHKSIFAFEQKLDLNVANASCQTRFHPRCGTSFLLLAAVLTMLGFMLIDSFLVHFFGDFKGVFHRVLVHIPFLPIVAGVSFEFLRWVE